MKKLSLMQKYRLFTALSKATDQIQEGIQMKKLTKVLLGIVTVVSAFYQLPGVQPAIVAFASAHKGSVGVALGLAILGALVHDPKVAQIAQAPVSQQIPLPPKQ